MCVLSIKVPIRKSLEILNFEYIYIYIYNKIQDLTIFEKIVKNEKEASKI